MMLINNVININHHNDNNDDNHNNVQMKTNDIDR